MVFYNSVSHGLEIKKRPYIFYWYSLAHGCGLLCWLVVETTARVPSRVHPKYRHKCEANFVFKCHARCLNHAQDIEANTGQIDCQAQPTGTLKFELEGLGSVLRVGSCLATLVSWLVLVLVCR